MEEILYQRKEEADDSLCILEKLGYSKEQAEKRVQIYENAGKGGSLYETVKFQVDYNIVIAGSRGDGTGVYADCDVDKLLVQNHLQCIEKGIDAKIYNNSSTVLEIDTEDVPNGYTKLKFISKAENQKDDIHTKIPKFLKDEKGELYLRNDCKLSAGIGRDYTDADCGWIEKNLVHADIKSGPSKPYRIQIPFVSFYILFDDVLAFRCVFPTIIDTWCNRERSKDWPSKELVENVKEMEVYVVPVRVKGSKDEHLQWRICLTQVELAMVQSFNDTQIKVYGALKMITKHHLTPRCENITSYIIKIVLFWQMEQTYCSE
ncbi:uncharacterized protein LOC128547372 [Mercenaria mercenaria]|uniref:uncharacterized protein LOC128547372 n=1 Tax=Mercenaria mercenaria TaxID=6596 RepID=UPI00234ECD0B|nr:uncharacterized protein LOC128547372 [Mercenaria mercenaria]